MAAAVDLSCQLSAPEEETAQQSVLVEVTEQRSVLAAAMSAQQSVLAAAMGLVSHRTLGG